MKERKDHIRKKDLTGLEFLPVKSGYYNLEPIKFIDPITLKDASLPSTNADNPFQDSIK